MTHTYAAQKLLEHGPLSFGEFMTITGWKRVTCKRILEYLSELGAVYPINVDGRRKYGL